MPIHYVTFGQDHVHKIGDKILYKNVVARFQANTPSEGREKAFELFGPKFSFEYHDQKWNEENMKYFPDGYVDL